VALLTIERQVTDLLGELSRRGQVAGRDRRLGRHLVRVEQLEPAAERLPPQRGQQLSPAQRAGRRGPDVAVGKLDAGLQVQRGALAHRVAGPPGQRDAALG